MVPYIRFMFLRESRVFLAFLTGWKGEGDGTYFKFFFKSSLLFSTELKFTGLPPQHFGAATVFCFQILQFFMNTLQCTVSLLMDRIIVLLQLQPQSRKAKKKNEFRGKGRIKESFQSLQANSTVNVMHTVKSHLAESDGASVCMSRRTHRFQQFPQAQGQSPRPVASTRTLIL